mgnify:CR=1 FL=1
MKEYHQFYINGSWVDPINGLNKLDVLNPATEYVRKFTEEVPREKVLLIKDVMDVSKDNLGDLKVSKDEIIENVAEKILTQEKSVAVVDSNNKIIGSINPTKIINTVFGGRKNGN